MTDDLSPDSKAASGVPAAFMFLLGVCVLSFEYTLQGLIWRFVSSVPWTVDFILALVTSAPLPLPPPFGGVAITLMAALVTVQVAVMLPFALPMACWWLSRRLTDLAFPR